MKNIVFLNIGWMESYKGRKDDQIRGGGAYVDKFGRGWEILNFLPQRGYYHGFCQALSSKTVDMLGGSEEDDSIKDVFVVWVAKNPSEGGRYIIGWYKNATIYRERTERKYEGKWIGWSVEAKVKDSKLLDMNERVFRIKTGKGWFGQRNIWYADKPRHESFKKEVLNFINKGTLPKGTLPSPIKTRKALHSWQADIEKRQKVERKAVEITIKHFERKGYKVEVVELEKKGWDLEAERSGQVLKLEVKGLSGEDVAIELTPNEYEQMKRCKNSYKICVVTNALMRPKLKIFSHRPKNRWEDESGGQLEIIEVKSARMVPMKLQIY